MAHPGPTELGRGVVVLPGGDVPPPWAACPRVIVGEAETVDPGPTVDVLHGLWLERQPVVVELGVDPGTLRAPERYDGPVHGLDPGFEFTLERLHFLVWANTYDARHGDPVWWHGRRAARLLADEGASEGGAADITLADGTPLYVDGGPAGPPPSRRVRGWCTAGTSKRARPARPVAPCPWPTSPPTNGPPWITSKGRPA